MTIEDDCLNPGHSGYIFHFASRKPVHPKGGSSNPSDNTQLVIHEVIDATGRLNVRFVPSDRLGKYGYIQHVASQKYVHPKGGSDNTKLVYHTGTHQGVVFTFNVGAREIMHIGGKI